LAVKGLILLNALFRIIFSRFLLLWLVFLILVLLLFIMPTHMWKPWRNCINPFVKFFILMIIVIIILLLRLIIFNDRELISCFIIIIILERLFIYLFMKQIRSLFFLLFIILQILGSINSLIIYYSFWDLGQHLLYLLVCYY